VIHRTPKYGKRRLAALATAIATALRESSAGDTPRTPGTRTRHAGLQRAGAKPASNQPASLPSGRNSKESGRNYSIGFPSASLGLSQPASCTSRQLAPLAGEPGGPFFLNFVFWFDDARVDFQEARSREKRTAMRDGMSKPISIRRARSDGSSGSGGFAIASSCPAP
jgi:hypothetical protein